MMKIILFFVMCNSIFAWNTSLKRLRSDLFLEKRKLVDSESRELLVQNFLEAFHLLKDPQINNVHRNQIVKYLQQITQELKGYIKDNEDVFFKEILSRGYRPPSDKVDDGIKQLFKWGKK
ncbi:unnamed protein product [Brachionus calyciflorus]|uniref:Uncharacterized protein n=1 Tax=Brachionus calyciflorus TaxID=104777 RepID=A0A814L1V5_9BILA|nr:unnamed protein product [Brachionus calyciflorus]